MSTQKRKLAIVTGGSRGIGKAVSLLLAEGGCNVVVNYFTNKCAAEETCHEIEKLGCGAMCVPIRADCSNPRDVATLFSNATEKVDAFVFCLLRSVMFN